MIEWLLTHAKDFIDIFTLGGIFTAGGTYVVHMLMTGRKQVQQLFEQQRQILEQLKPNGGASMFDMVKSAAMKADQTAKALASLTEDVKRVRSYQWNFAETLSDKPIWESDQDGKCVRVNGQYAKLAERDTTELVGSGWENFVDPLDRERVYEEWGEAVKRKRVFESSFNVRSKSGKKFSVRAVAMPITTDTGKVVAFIGRYDEVKLL